VHTIAILEVLVCLVIPHMCVYASPPTFNVAKLPPAIIFIMYSLDLDGHSEAEDSILLMLYSASKILNSSTEKPEGHLETNQNC